MGQQGHEHWDLPSPMCPGTGSLPSLPPSASYPHAPSFRTSAPCLLHVNRLPCLQGFALVVSQPGNAIYWPLSRTFWLPRGWTSVQFSPIHNVFSNFPVASCQVFSATETHTPWCLPSGRGRVPPPLHHCFHSPGEACWVLSTLGYYEACCYEHSCITFCVKVCFQIS